MIKALSVIASFGVLLISFFSFGSFYTCSKRKDDGFDLCLTLLSGFFIYYIVFQIVAVPMMFMQLPLHILTFAWSGILLVVNVVSFIKFRLVWIVEGKRLLCRENIFQINYWIPAVILAANIAFVFFIGRNYWDATYYVGTVSYSVYYDVINTYDPTTGNLLDQFDIRHCLATYHMNDAVFCQLFRVHPLIQTKTIMTVMITILHNVVYYRIGKGVFSDNKKAIACFMFFVAMTVLFTFSDYTASGFALYRTYEGKALAASIIMASLFLAFLYLQREFEKPKWWIFLLLVSWGAAAVSSSAMILVPAAIAAFVISQWIMKRRVSRVWSFIAAVTPCMAIFILYILNRLGLFVVSIKG